MTQNPSIYKIDRKHYLLKKHKTIEAVLKQILSTNPIIKEPKAKIPEPTIHIIGDFTYYLYVFEHKERASDWENFLPQELTQQFNFSQKLLSLVLFIKTEQNLLAVVGGNAFRIVLPYLDESYGLNTYSRIMERDRDELMSIRSRGITGNRIGMKEQFRKEFRIIDFIKFGKVPIEIMVKLSFNTGNDHFSFLKEKNNERINIEVGKGFKVKKAIEFHQLHKLITELDFIQKLPPSDYLSSYEEVTDQGFIYDQLDPLLIQTIFDDIPFVEKKVSESYRNFEFDFCDPNNIEEFYLADKYLLKEKTEEGGHKLFATLQDKNEIYDRVMKHAIATVGGSDKFSLRVFLQGVRIACYRNGIKTAGAAFLYHFNAEFNISGTPYFLVDKKWYRLRETFIEELNTDTVHIFNANRLPEPMLYKPWDKGTIAMEKDYNLAYLNEPNYIICDTVTVDGIELCDLLYITSGNIYLIHVKYGFGGKVRELANQIVLSAKRLKDCLGTADKTWLKTTFERLATAGKVNGMEFNKFLELFTRRKVSYVFATASHLIDDLHIEEHIEKFSSNIAKFSLIECARDMKLNYYELYVGQIFRTAK